MSDYPGGKTMSNTPDNIWTVTFHDSRGSVYPVPRHRKGHRFLGDAVAEVRRVDKLRSGSARAACPGIVIGPDGGQHRVTGNPTT